MTGPDGRPGDGFMLGVDLGTSHTVAMLRWSDGRTRPVLFDGQPLLPSAGYLDTTGRLHVGRDALRLGYAEPGRFEPNPKRHIDERTVLLGGAEVPVAHLLAALLGAVAREAVATTGFLPPAVLTHPAAWGEQRREVLIEAITKAGWPRETQLLPEPVAAARYFADVLRRPVPVGSALAVFDLGGGTLDVAVVRNEGLGPDGRSRFVVAASGGADDLGGLDLDAALVDHLGKSLAGSEPQAWQALTEPVTLAQWRARRQFWEDVRGAKEMLSRAAFAPVPVPGVEHVVQLTREELEAAVGPLVRRGVTEAGAVITAAGLTPRELAGLFLVGGSSRVPLVARLLHSELGISPTVLEQPELPVAEGAIVASTGSATPAATYAATNAGGQSAAAVAGPATADLPATEADGPLDGSDLFSTDISGSGSGADGHGRPAAAAAGPAAAVPAAQTSPAPAGSHSSDPASGSPAHNAPQADMASGPPGQGHIPGPAGGLPAEGAGQPGPVSGPPRRDSAERPVSGPPVQQPRFVTDPPGPGQAGAAAGPGSAHSGPPVAPPQPPALPPLPAHPPTADTIPNKPPPPNAPTSPAPQYAKPVDPWATGEAAAFGAVQGPAEPWLASTQPDPEPGIGDERTGRAYKRKLFWFVAAAAVVVLGIGATLVAVFWPKYPALDFHSLSSAVAFEPAAPMGSSFAAVAVRGDRAYFASVDDSTDGDDQLSVVAADTTGSDKPLWAKASVAAADRWEQFVVTPYALVAFSARDSTNDQRLMVLLDPDTGELLWKQSIGADDNIMFSGDVAVLVDRVHHELVGLEVRNEGARRWAHPTPASQYGLRTVTVIRSTTVEDDAGPASTDGTAYAAPLADDTRIVQIGADRSAQVIDAVTGTVQAPIKGVADPEDEVIAHNGRLIVAESDEVRRIVEYDLANPGLPKVLYNAPSDDTQFESLTECGADRVCFVATTGSDDKTAQIVAVDAVKGGKVWDSPLTGVQTLVPVGDTLLAGQDSPVAQVSLLNAEGTVVWTKPGAAARLDAGNVLLFSKALTTGLSDPSLAGWHLGDDEPQQLGPLTDVRSSTCAWDTQVIACAADEKFQIQRFAG